MEFWRYELKREGHFGGLRLGALCAPGLPPFTLCYSLLERFLRHHVLTEKHDEH